MLMTIPTAAAAPETVVTVVMADGAAGAQIVARPADLATLAVQSVSSAMTTRRTA